jgi:DNA topoisomerase I
MAARGKGPFLNHSGFGSLLPGPFRSQLSRTSTLIEQNRRAARDSGLKYVSDEHGGVKRVRNGRGMIYLDATGKRVRDRGTLKRIASLVIPPAWKDVWICRDPRGHIQAVVRDARGRKQYRYHARWREARDRDKYHNLKEFAAALPRIRRTIRRHLRQRGLPRDKVLATVLAVMERTLIRVGNEEYAGTNGSFGLTTFRDRHARINGHKVLFEFRGKSGVRHAIDLHNPELARIIRRCRDLPGLELFQYMDDTGQVCDVGSTDVNDYLRRISGSDFTTKDFRTWSGTVLAACALCELEKFTSQAQAKRNVARAVDVVAQQLGNTRAVCRKSYIHPAVIQAYLDGTLAGVLKQSRPGRTLLAGLRAEENEVLAFLRRRSRGTRKGK